MAWEGSTRAERLPSDWSTRRLRVLRRDGYRCQARDSRGAPCMAPANQVDHVRRGDDHSLENLQALCRPCHARKSSKEGVEARRPPRRRPAEAHPGLIAPPAPPTLGTPSPTPDRLRPVGMAFRPEYGRRAFHKARGLDPLRALQIPENGRESGSWRVLRTF